MRAWQEHLARVALGATLGAAGGIVALRFGDTVDPAVLPSHVYQIGNYTWPAGIIWWWLAGAVIGVCGGAISFRYRGRVSTLSLIAATVAVVAMNLVLAYLALASVNAVSVPNLLIEWATYTAFFTIITALPILLIVIILSSTFALGKSRSALEIMPNELRQPFEAQRARERALPWYRRVLHRSAPLS